MKRFVYTLPVFALLLPWTFISFVIFAVGFFVTPWSLLLLLPVGAVLAAAFHVHQRRAKHEQHLAAALGASLVLMAPLVVIVVAFFTHGRTLAQDQFDQMFFEPAPACNAATGGYDCELTF